VAAKADNLEPVDELVTSLIKEHGELLLAPNTSAGRRGRWIAVPTGVSNHGADPMRSHRPLQAVFRARLNQMYRLAHHRTRSSSKPGPGTGFFAAAEKCAKAGYPFGMPLSTWSDLSQLGERRVRRTGRAARRRRRKHQSIGRGERGFGVVQENRTVLAASVFAWDNAANNKWLISGQAP